MRRGSGVFVQEKSLKLDIFLGLKLPHCDKLKSSLSLDVGERKDLIEYLPFGGESRREKSYDNPEQQARYTFANQYKDDETGLIFMQARYYDPSLGRFITPDTIVAYPINPQSFNRYNYVHNNPVNFVDPTGNFAWLAFFAFIGKAAAVVAKVAAVVSVATTAVGLATGNQTLLNIGRISGFVALGASALSGGVNSLVVAKASAGTQLVEAPTIYLDTIVVSKAATQAAVNADIALAAGNLAKEAVTTAVASGASVGTAMLSETIMAANSGVSSGANPNDASIDKAYNIFVGASTAGLNVPNSASSKLYWKSGQGIGSVKRAANNRFYRPGTSYGGFASKSVKIPITKALSRSLGVAATTESVVDLYRARVAGDIYGQINAGAMTIANGLGFFSPLRLLPVAASAVDLGSQAFGRWLYSSVQKFCNTATEKNTS